ncbi:methyl-accepting chemotaxis protein [Gallaecimonas mangrovi]|uniref:methyl-accepting chemotaxis protein n=1 Tax=Gallaecimonas mangrovi TaxID=2291597 RepID=UPI001869222A|nr:methyl-accepting chemotaxis protein [Gallaecimonas mangrovi]
MSTLPRTMLAFSILLLLLVVMGGFALWQASKINQSVERIQNQSMARLGVAGSLAENMARMRITAFQFYVFTAPDIRQHFLDNWNKISAQVDDNLKTYGELVKSDKGRSILATLNHYNDIYKKEAMKLRQMAIDGHLPEALAQLNMMNKTYAYPMINNAAALAKMNAEAAEGEKQNAAQVYKDTQIWTVLLTLVSLLVGALLTWRFSLSIVGPMREALTIARRIADNDLTGHIAVQGNDEAADMLKAFETMQSNLRQAMGQIGSSATQLASASEQMSAITNDAMKMLTRQNDEIDQAVTAVTEMSAAVEEVAGNAVQTSEQSKSSTETAASGRKQVDEAVHSLETLVNNVRNASEQALVLAEETGNISKMLDVIRAVSEQTNLLALNAAIEAARAGDAGRGFAVVADEVRNLAKRTAESTNEIENMISSVQRGTQDTVSALQMSVDHAGETLTKASMAGEALSTIESSVSAINDRNLVIATAAEEQAQVAREVDQNLVSIRDLSYQTSTGAGEANTASKELAKLATDLNAMLRRFKV